MAPSISATNATMTSEMEAPSPHKKSAFCGSSTTSLLTYGAYSAATMTVVQADSATSYIHQPRISFFVTGGGATCFSIVAMSLCFILQAQLARTNQTELICRLFYFDGA